MRVDDNFILGGVGRGREPDRPRADGGGQFGEPGGIHGRRRHVVFQIAGDAHARSAELREATGVVSRLRQHEIDASQKRSDRAGQPTPAAKRPGRQAGVHENQRNRPFMGRVKQIGPELRLGDEREVRTPVVEEPPHEARRVDRQKLVRRARRQSGRQHTRRTDGARRQKNMKSARDEPINQGQKRKAFADAGAMKPGQRTSGPVHAGEPQSFAQPRAVLLAAALAPAEQQGGEGAQRRRGRPIGEQIGFHHRVHMAGSARATRSAPGSALSTRR